MAKEDKVSLSCVFFREGVFELVCLWEGNNTETRFVQDSTQTSRPPMTSQAVKVQGSVHYVIRRERVRKTDDLLTAHRYDLLRVQRVLASAASVNLPAVCQ